MGTNALWDNKFGMLEDNYTQRMQEQEEAKLKKEELARQEVEKLKINAKTQRIIVFFINSSPIESKSII